MILVFIIISLILSALIITERKDGIRVLIYFSVGVMLIRNLSIVGVLTTNRLLCFSLFICLILNKKYLTNVRDTPLLWLLVLIAINYMFIGLMDDRYSFGALLGRISFRYLTQFFLFIAGFLLSKYSCNFDRYLCAFYKLSFATAVLTFFNYILRTDIIGQLLGTDIIISVENRLRVCSFTYYVENGFIGVIAFICAFVNPNSILSKFKRWLLILSSILTIFLCGFRINVAILFVALSSLIILRGKRNIKYVLPILVLMVASYISVPYVQYFVDQTIALSDDSSDMGGSSTSMREVQWSVAWEMLKEKPLWGHGFSYFHENILSDGFNEGLMGAEGYYVLMFIEEGFIQALLSTLFFLLIQIYFYKRKDNVYGQVGFALSVIFLVFCIGTRPDNMWLFLFPLLGLMAYKSSNRLIN